jgi:hypothetical protein
MLSNFICLQITSLKWQLNKELLEKLATRHCVAIAILVSRSQRYLSKQKNPLRTKRKRIEIFILSSGSYESNT